MFLLVYIDTKFYGADEWVFTSYNFLEMNVLHGLSKYFGISDVFFYFRPGFINIFVFMFVAAVQSLFFHIYIRVKGNGDYPYTALYVIFYIFVFTVIPHKETRFLMPCIPFVFICIGELLDSSWLKAKPRCTAVLIKVQVLISIVITYLIIAYQRRSAQLRMEIYDQDPDMHSMYNLDVYNSAVHTILHRKDKPVKVYAPNKDNQFAKVVFGFPLPLANESDSNMCLQMLDSISSKEIRPQYV